MRLTLFRAHEWLAERFDAIQYPSQHASPAPFFKHQMPAELRFALLVFGVVAVLVSAVLLFFLGLIAWAAITD